MPSFSQRSANKLQTCHKDLQLIFNEVIKSYDCTIIKGYRSNEMQEKLFDDKKTRLRAGQSKHNQLPSLAVDAVPYPIDWRNNPKNLARYYHFVGYVHAVADRMKIKIRCGADWDGDFNFEDQNFDDLPHFELS